MKRLLVALLCLVVMLAGCTPLPAPSIVPTILPVSPQPTLISPLAPGVSPLASPAAIITPGRTDKATITGVLMVNAQAPAPAAGVILGLAGILPNAAGTPAAAGYDKMTAPRTQTDATGRFVFANVPVQSYALILDQFNGSFMLKQPNSDDDMLLNPRGGQVLDLGTLVYPSLPGN